MRRAPSAEPGEPSGSTASWSSVTWCRTPVRGPSLGNRWQEPAPRDLVVRSLERRSVAGADVHHPGHAELVDAHAELVAPHLLLERHRHGAVRGELLPVPTQ